MIDPEILDRDAKIAEIDKQGMLERVSSFPAMLEEGIKLGAVPAEGLKPTDRTFICGMGGSAICGDIISDAFSSVLDSKIEVIRGYKLPRSARRGDLACAVSYSGNTEETLSCVDDAEKRGLKILAVSSGGKLSEIAGQRKYPLISIPQGVQPRAALPYFLSSILVAFERIGLIVDTSTELKESIKVLKGLREEYLKERRTNPVKHLAQKIYDKVPLIYSSDHISSAARRMAAQLNENGKIIAHSAVFPELNHNELVGLSDLKRGGHSFALIILRDEGDLERTKKRIEITKSLIGASLGGVSEVTSSGKGKLARLLSLIFFGDLLSVYVALLRGVDPTPVEIIEKLKRELSR